jgi:CRISPR system Cascade subunit CasB
MTISINPSAKEIAREVLFLELLKKRLGVKTKQEKEDENKQKKKEEENLAGQAILKRAMSGDPTHITKVHEFMPRNSLNLSIWEEGKILIPVACLFVYYPQKIDRVQDPKKRNFGRSCWNLAMDIDKTGQSKGTPRRFKALLDTSLADIQSPLNNLVRQMKSRGIPIDYPQLLIDLQQWEHPKQYIQDNWARTYWGAAPPNTENPIEELIDSTEIDN